MKLLDLYSRDACPVCGQTPCNCTFVAEGLRDPQDNPCWKGYHPVGTKKKNGRTVPNCVPNANEDMAEGLDNYEFHTSVPMGDFLPSRHGKEKYLYLHDLTRKSGDGKGPMLVTVERPGTAVEIANEFGGKAVKTKLGTYRIVKPREGMEEGLGKDLKRLATGKDAKSRAGQEIAKSQDASMKGNNKTANKHFRRYDRLDKLANKEQGVAEGSDPFTDGYNAWQQYLNGKTNRRPTNPYPAGHGMGQWEAGAAKAAEGNDFGQDDSRYDVAEDQISESPTIDFIRGLISEFNKQMSGSPYYPMDYKNPGMRMWTRGDGSKYKDPGYIFIDRDLKPEDQPKWQKAGAVEKFWKFLESKGARKIGDVSGEFGSDPHSPAVVLNKLIFVFNGRSIAWGSTSRLKNSNVWRQKQQGVVEDGPFSYGAKKPRRGSVAANAEQKRKEQKRDKRPIEPKDQMVGTAKVTKNVSEGSESSIEKKIRAKQDALSLAREQRRAKGQRQQGQREIKLQAEIDKLNTELTQLKKQDVAEYGDTARGQKMLTKVQKRAVDRMIKAADKGDAKNAKKNQDTANRAWDRMDTSEGVAEDDEAVRAFLAKGGQIQHGKTHKPRKGERWQGSSHIGAAGGSGTKGRVSGLAANTNPKSGKPVVSAEGRDQGQTEKIGDRYDPDEFDSMVRRLQRLAGSGPMKTVWDPEKRVYKNVPVNPPKPTAQD